MLKIRNLRNKNKAVANQFIVTDGENGLIYFQSYDRVIVQLDYHRKTCMLSPKWEKSKTTIKYTCVFFSQILGIKVDYSDLRKMENMGMFYNTGTKFDDWKLM